LSGSPFTLGDGERHGLAVEWNATAIDYPRDATVHALFEAQAARTPDAVALVAGARAITYAELDRRANRLAHALLRLGVEREAAVGLCLERSPELVIGKLGILKAGAACLPMSAAFPRQRIAYLLADAQARAVLTVRSTADRIPIDFPALCLDEAVDPTAGMPAESPDLPVLPTHLSYVIHTSGSTGMPKGVLITHRGVVRNLMAPNPFSFRGDDTVLQYAPVTFDAATYEIFGTLLLGAKLAIADPGDLSLEELGAHLGRAQVSAAWLTAALFHQMAEYRIDDLRGLRKIVSGGESLSVRQVRKVLRELPETELVNGYGPTENTMFSNALPVRHLPEGAANVPIGRPVANCTAYVVDRDFLLLPLGAEGEVWVGGDGLARGYLGRPELSAEKFVPDPFGVRPGERLYRSGDLGRFLPGGEIEFLGRIDRLV
jgi:amino acid adenylation domain-containing protein